MSGDPPAIRIEAAAGSVLARAIEALARFPTEPPWALFAASPCSSASAR